MDALQFQPHPGDRPISHNQRLIPNLAKHRRMLAAQLKIRPGLNIAEVPRILGFNLSNTAIALAVIARLVEENEVKIEPGTATHPYDRLYWIGAEVQPEAKPMLAIVPDGEPTPSLEDPIQDRQKALQALEIALQELEAAGKPFLLKDWQERAGVHASFIYRDHCKALKKRAQEAIARLGSNLDSASTAQKTNRLLNCLDKFMEQGVLFELTNLAQAAEVPAGEFLNFKSYSSVRSRAIAYLAGRSHVPAATEELEKLRSEVQRLKQQLETAGQARAAPDDWLCNQKLTQKARRAEITEEIQRLTEEKDRTEEALAAIAILQSIQPTTP